MIHDPDLSRARGLPLNRDELVTITVSGEVAAPLEKSGPWRIGQDGRVRVLPGTGGIVLSHRIGDPCVGLAADHVEPAVSIRNERRTGGGDAANQALQTLACVGNEAIIMSGRAIGAKGIVTGKHGGVDTVLVDFPLQVMRRMANGDRVQIYARGAGLRITECPAVSVFNCSPLLLDRWGLRLSHGRISAPVTHLIPARLMGSGLGKNNVAKGDYDIQMCDAKAVRRHRLGSLRFGDLVAIADADNRFGRSHLAGRVSLGVIVHSESTVAGHGPGVVTLLSGPAERFRLIRNPEANIATYLGVRTPVPPRHRDWLPVREAAERRRSFKRAPTTVPAFMGG
jgi:hypothetical protein